MSDAPIEISRRLAERKKACRDYEINEFNEITPLPEPLATSCYQPMDRTPDEAVGGNETK
jgi:hypothetical protein